MSLPAWQDSSANSGSGERSLSHAKSFSLASRGIGCSTNWMFLSVATSHSSIRNASSFVFQPSFPSTRTGFPGAVEQRDVQSTFCGDRNSRNALQIIHAAGDIKKREFRRVELREHVEN